MPAPQVPGALIISFVMKKIFFSILALSGLALLMLSSCKKDETRVTSSLGNTGTLAVSSTSPALSLATGANVATTFSWPATPVSGVASTVTYTIQIDKKGNNFKSPREIAASSLNTPVTVVALNMALLNLNLPVDVPAQVEVRVKSVIAANVAPTYSSVVTLTVTPYSLVSYLYLPGSYQGWNPAGTDALTISSPTSNGIYDGTVTFTGTGSYEFKFTPARNWDLDYGGKDGVLAKGGANLVVTAGTYKIHADLNTLTYTLVRQ